MRPRARFILLLSTILLSCEHSTTPSAAINGSWDMVYQLGGASTLRSMAFTDEDNGWIVGPDGAIVHTTDGGESFASQNSGTSEDLVSVSFSDAGHGWAVGKKNFVLHTTDGGTSWTPVHIDDDSSQTIWSVKFVNPTTGWLLSNSGKLYGTRDAGETWNLQLTWQSGGAGLMSFVDSDVGFVRPGIGDFWYRTSDGGDTWSAFSMYSDMRWERDLFFVDRLHGWLCNDRLASSVAHDSASVFRTTDGGESWWLTHRFPELFCNKLYFVNEEDGWVASKGIYYTPDGGDTWVRQTNSEDRIFIDLQFVGRSVGYALDFSGALFRFRPE